MTVPKRPKAQPVTVQGTGLKRTYVAPGAADRVQLGDIVLYKGKQWDVVGSHALAPLAADGTQPLSLMLERMDRPIAGKKRVIREHAQAQDCTILGRQILLPGTPPVAAVEVQRDRDTG